MSGSVETPLRFECAGARLLGVLHRPAAGREKPVGVLIVVGGPQYRVGSHRSFVEVARGLADAGYPVLRFDCRGQGDSEGDFPGFERIAPDMRAAANAFLAAVPKLERLVLWGLCDAASAISMHAAEDIRIGGAVLLNPWVREEEAAIDDETLLKHYYASRFLSRAFWRKLVRFDVDLRDFPRHVLRVVGRRSKGSGTAEANELAARMRMGLERFRKPVLLVMSGQDLTAREFEAACARDPAWRAVLSRADVTRLDIEAADHTFSGAAAKNRLIERLIAWLESV